ncbi:MAG: SH3 domain-containing protein [bacterium]|nr:SH3 domain-containing protein [bacterium]
MFKRFNVLILVLSAVMVCSAIFTTTPSISAQGNCPPLSNLRIGYTGFVSIGLPNVLRSQAGMSSAQIGTLNGGQLFTVLGGPICADGYNWWQVEAAALHGGTYSGWTADGTFSEDWLFPWQCDLLWSRLIPGYGARVTPGLPNTLRALPGGGATLGSIPVGGQMVVVSGPECIGGRTWWNVNYNGQTGWTAEGEGSTYWLEPSRYTVPPVTPPPTPRPVSCLLPTRLWAGYAGIVTPGEPNVLRDLPGRNASGSRVLGSINGGTVFRVIEGPVCADGIHWWRVAVGNQMGWTAEGENGIYWLDPVVCANGLRSQLVPGMTTYVTPGLPQNIRSAPDVNSGRVLASAAPGERMRVLANFRCDAVGRLWWQVQYGRLTGWVAEGENGVYWVAPQF